MNLSGSSAYTEVWMAKLESWAMLLGLGQNTRALVDRQEMAWVRLLWSEVIKIGAMSGLILLDKLDMLKVFWVGVFVTKLFSFKRLGHSLLI